jgi:hypothetical protein
MNLLAPFGTHQEKIMWRLWHSDDARQIKRWQNMKRHILWLQNGCGVRGLLSCRPRQRQALLHWAYDSRKL